MTHDDLTEAETVIAQLILSEDALRDLADRMRRKDEHSRADRLKVIADHVGQARYQAGQVFA